VSGEIAGAPADLRAVTDPAVESGVACGDLLLAFADALVGEDDAALERAREALLGRLGPEGLVDAAAVASSFERMVRIADGTGIPLDAPARWFAAGLRSELALDSFGSAANTPAPTRAGLLAARALAPFSRTLLRRTIRPRRA
jgi:hypothetical protein